MPESPEEPQRMLRQNADLLCRPRKQPFILAPMRDYARLPTLVDDSLPWEKPAISSCRMTTVARGAK